MISTNYAAMSARRSLAGGDLKPRWSPLGIELRAMFSGEVCGYGLLAHARIQWWQRPELGWPVAAAATSWAVAGVQPAMVWVMPSKGGAVVSRVRLTEVR